MDSPHGHSQEEPGLSLELMHMESELTENEVEPTDNLPAKKPQPEKTPTGMCTMCKCTRMAKQLNRNKGVEYRKEGW